jgi:hypothetical protein
MTTERPMTATEAARALDRDVSIVRDLCRRGLFPGAYKHGPVWFIPAEAVRQMAARPRKPGPPPKRGGSRGGRGG